MSNGLIRYDAACKALAKAVATDEVKLIRDKADAMRAAAKIANNKQLEVDAAEIRIRAERRWGAGEREVDCGGGESNGGAMHVIETPAGFALVFDGTNTIEAPDGEGLTKEFCERVIEWNEKRLAEGEREQTDA